MKLRKEYRSAFTLIELLVVMAIIGILSGLIFTAVVKVQLNARKAKAKIQIKQLEKAFVAYFDEYGEWPINLIDYDSNPDEDHLTGIQFGENAAKLLSGKEDGPDEDRQNNRNIAFLDIPITSVRLDGHGTIGFVDPWNHCYKYMMDFNDDGVVKVQFSNASGSGDNTDMVSGQGVVIWSQGPDGNDAFVGDNITSWKSQ